MGLRLVFFGTPAFALPTLDRLLASSHEVVAVVTQPDRPRGRGQKVQAGAVKTRAERAGLPILQPDRIADPGFLESVASLGADLGVVAAYGKLLPQRLLALPHLGLVNVHASLLPRWRGAAPVHRAIIAGDTETGVTIMRVVKALDAGPMLASVHLAIDPDETSAELEVRLGAAGAVLLVDTVDRLATGPVPEQAQDESLVTYARRLERSDSRIDWARPALAVHNQIRGLHPWPLAAATLHGRRLRLTASAVAGEPPSPAAPGTVVAVPGDALVVATSPGTVRLTRVQPEGRPVMAVRDFLNGRRVVAGERFAPLSPDS